MAVIAQSPVLALSPPSSIGLRWAVIHSYPSGYAQQEGSAELCCMSGLR